MLAADEGARLIAGGQTLVPLMAMRLARPTRLVDIARIRELAFVREQDGERRHRRDDAAMRGRARSAGRRQGFRCSREAMPWVGHAATRARGTVGGSLANADPAAEISLVAVTLGATLTYRDGDETSEIAAADYFLGPMITALPMGACLTAVRFPVWPEARVGAGFHEVSARRSDFAFVSAAAQVALDQDGVCRASRSASAR